MTQGNISFPVQHLPLNTAGVDFVVGDIHGNFDLLGRLLHKAGYRYQKDRVIALGDLVDRGPQPRRAIDFLNAKGCYSVRGNHEDMLIEARDTLKEAGNNEEHRRALTQILAPILHKNGSDWFLGESPTGQNVLADAFSKLPYAIEIETAHGLIGCVHAEPPVTDWNDLSAALSGELSKGFITRALWSRDQILQRRVTIPVSNVFHVYCGHTIVECPVTIGSTTWIDTGAFATGRLTAVRLDTLEFIQT